VIARTASVSGDMASPPDTDEQLLLRRVASGDAAALRGLHERMARPLYSLAFKMLSNASESEEVIQDVFLSVWKNAHKFDPGRAKVFTWMTVLTRNKCIDKIRAKQRRIPTADTRDDGDQVVAEVDGANAADDLLEKERADSIRAAVKTLPAEQREAVELAFFSGMTHVQVAEKLGISIGTAKSRIRYAFQKLRAPLKSQLDHYE
jgi:RNA polymerase sigma factor (sigma-70 family)